MQILIAEDDPFSRRLLEGRLKRWGYDVVAVEDGRAAIDALRTPDGPRIAILDWMMPAVDGPTVCQTLRAEQPNGGHYLILLTARGEREDLLAGFEAGADDYVTKPFDAAELEARLRVGARVVAADQALMARVQELEAALAQIRELRGLLPICAHCKRIRDDRDYWHDVESYVSDHADVQFTHGICPTCLDRVLAEDP
jgi:sigma-B regulation protein RsbU (phosphoserine phosphatase)